MQNNAAAARTDSGQELPPLKPARAYTAEEACAAVDGWGVVAEGTDFGLHNIARALRAEVTRLNMEVETLNDALLDEMANSSRGDY